MANPEYVMVERGVLEEFLALESTIGVRLRNVEAMDCVRMSLRQQIASSPRPEVLAFAREMGEVETPRARGGADFLVGLTEGITDGLVTQYEGQRWLDVRASCVRLARVAMHLAALAGGEGE